jgi:ribosomal protein S18 acetylase RimI-like enzyme
MADSPSINRGDAVGAGEYRDLLLAVGWRPPEQSDEEVESGLAATWNLTVRAHDGRLIGLVRVLDDGLLYASIWDLIVAPEFQRQGIGRALLEAALARTADRRLVSLIATSAGDTLYRSAGFAERDSRSTALFMRQG